MDKELHILILEDLATDAEVMEMELRKGGIVFSSKIVETKEDFQQGLIDFAPDLILADYTLPSFNGLAALETAQKFRPEVPFIFVSATIGDELAIETLKKGATDYILKNKLSSLVPSVKRALREIEEKAERKRAEESLLKEKSFTDSAFNSLPGIFYLFDESGCIMRWNQNFEVVTGYSAEEISKMNPLDIFDREEKKLVTEKIQEVIIKGRSTGEAHLLSKDGRKIPYFFTGQLFICDNKKYILGTGIDITEHKQAEEKLKQLSEELARSNADLKDFAYVASHDLKKPLQSIEGFVKLLERRYKGKLDAKADELIEYIDSGVKRMQMLITDLLEYSQLGAKEKDFKPNDCTLIVEKAVGNLQAALEESNAVVTYDKLPTIVSDISQMISLFQNLIDNAIKFRGENIPRIQISAERKEDEWVFCIRDNGIGIDPKDSERIFGMFQRLHGSADYPGTGIGLAICKRIIEGHGGRIWVESEIGNGSTFYFTMPCTQKLSK